MSSLEVLPSGHKDTVKDEQTGLEVRIYYLECLAQATYAIIHEDSAMVVDPRRDVEAFIEELNQANVTLKGVLETHFHADFVSGHLELGERTGAPIYFGPTAGDKCKFKMHELKHGEVIKFTSRYNIKVLHTPGHTPESVVYLVVDRQNNKPLKAFTGDTLFIGSCGRPDLVGSIGYSSEDMARMMYCTLTDKILTLPDSVQVFPAHGAGSPCGKNLSNDLYSTIGKERLTNPALQFNDVSEFVKFLTSGQPTAPEYFSHDVHTNKEGAQELCKELAKIPRVNGNDFSKLCENGEYPIIDTRPSSEFNKGHIKGSVNMPLGGAGGAIVGVEDGNFSMWVGTLFSIKKGLLLVCDPNQEGETLQRLARIGYTKISAILEGGIEGWKSQQLPVLTSNRVYLKDDHNVLVNNGYTLLDVRTDGEYQSNTFQGAINVPLAEIHSKIKTLANNKSYLTFCKSGYRSIIAASMLRSHGFTACDVFGGFAAISVYCPEKTTTKEVCPSMKGIVTELEKLQH